MSSDIPQALYARLRDELRADILQGRLAVHQKLPSEHELVRQHGVSRITVRQALGDLQRDGLIVRLQGKGAYVAPARTSQPLERLQGMTEALAGQGQSVLNQRLGMRRLLPAASVAADLQLPAGEPVYELETLRHVDRRAVSVNRSYYPLAIGERLVRIDMTGRDVIDVLERDLGLASVRAQIEISAIGLSTDDARRLACPAGAPALQVRRLLLGADERALQVEFAIHRAEDFSYRLSVTR